MSWTQRPTLKPGRYPRGDELEATFDQIDSLTAPGWIDYSSTFTLTATTTSPTQGNSTYTAHYWRVAGGDKVTVRIYIAIGSTFSAGSGLYRFLVPVAASTNSINGTVGVVFIDDFGTALRTGTATFADSTHLEVFFHNSTAALGSSGPGTAWGTSDKIRMTVDYEPA